MNTGKPSFPLPRDHFAGAKLTPHQVARFKAITRAQLDVALISERENVLGEKRIVDTTRWEITKTKHELRIYKSRAHALFRAHASSSASSSSSSSTPSTAYGRAQPSMLSFGRMQGSLEDLIYGAYAASYDEMKTTCGYLGIGQSDCAVLHNLELATPDDPFHYLDLKWLLTPLPGSVIIKPRDWCIVNAMAIETDSEGKCFGFIITHSVDVVSCPPFGQRYVVRGQASLSFIFRESSSPGFIDLFAEGLYDPTGELIKQFSTTMTSEVLSGIFVTAKCAQAKKLTVMALRNNDLKNAASSSSTSSTSGGIQRACSYCSKPGSRFSPLRQCRVCCATACSKCRIKKPIFVGPNHSVVSVTCCHSCILKAKEMQVRPSEPQFSILGEKYISPDAIAGWSSSDDAASDSPDEPTPVHEMDFVIETNGDGVESDVREVTEQEEDTTELSCMSEVDVKCMIEAMVGQRLYDTKPASTTTAASSSHNRSSNDMEIEPVDEELDIRATTAMAAVHDGTYVTHIPSDEIKTLPPDQAAIYLQMLRLQNAAHHVYAITKANNELMMRSNTQ